MFRTNLMHFATLAAVGLLVAAPQAARAGLLAYEPFDYAEGLLGDNGDQADSTSDTGFSGDWLVGEGAISAGNLTPASASHTHYPLLGNHAASSGSGQRQGAVRALDTAAFGALNGTSGVGDGINGTMWLAYVNMWTNDQNTYDFYVALGNSLSTGINAEKAAGTLIVGTEADDGPLDDTLEDNYGLWIANGDAFDGSNWVYAVVTDANGGDIPENSNDVVVVRIDFSSTAGQDKAYLWINPGETEPAIGTAKATVTGDFAPFDTVRVGLAKFYNHFDEIRMASDYSSAVMPEPATLGLMALGGAGMLLVRRRRR